MRNCTPACSRSGATPDEAYFYTKALRMRIRQMQEIARGRDGGPRK